MLITTTNTGERLIVKKKKGFFSLTVLEVHTLKSGSSITVVSDEDGGEQGSTWTKDHPVSQQAQKEQPS